MEYIHKNRLEKVKNYRKYCVYAQREEEKFVTCIQVAIFRFLLPLTNIPV